MPPDATVNLTPAQFDSFARVLIAAFREVMEPAAAPRPDLVTVGETSDHKLDVRVFCPTCLGERGSRWPSHGIYWWGYDAEKPDRPKRHTVRVQHPDALKTISYDAQAVREGLESGTHGKQCIHCGVKLAVMAA
jgi:hypothetical protein